MISLIRYFYSRRAKELQFNRLSFALLSLATPGDLIDHGTRTPFNVTKAISIRRKITSV